MTFTHNFVQPLPLKQVTDPEGKRYYTTPEDKRYESVTSFIGRNWDKTHLIAWKKRLGEKKADAETKRASVRGTSIHKISENYLRNNVNLDLDTNPLEKVLYVKIKPLLDRLDNIRLLETPLYSDRLQLAGTPDFIGDYSEELAVVDFKTATRAKKKIWIVDYFLQAACYGVMFEEHYGLMPKKAVIIMASEALPYAQLFIEPMDRCIKMLDKFREDPILFQKVLKDK